MAVILPPSALAKLASLHIEYPMLFQLSSEHSGQSTHGGVLEFIAEEGRAYVPHWARHIIRILICQMMGQLGIEEGEIVAIKNVNLPRGKFVKIQPQSVAFLDISDPRAV